MDMDTTDRNKQTKSKKNPKKRVRLSKNMSSKSTSAKKASLSEVDAFSNASGNYSSDDTTGRNKQTKNTKKLKKRVCSSKNAMSSKNRSTKKASPIKVDAFSKASENYNSDDTEVVINKKQYHTRKGRLNKQPAVLVNTKVSSTIHQSEEGENSDTHSKTPSLHGSIHIKSEAESSDECNESSSRFLTHKLLIPETSPMVVSGSSDCLADEKDFKCMNQSKNVEVKYENIQKIKNVKTKQQSQKKRAIKTKSRINVMNEIKQEQGVVQEISTHITPTAGQAINLNTTEDESITSRHGESEPHKDTPSICYRKLMEFLKELAAEESSNIRKKNVDLCQRIMNPSYDYHTRFSSRTFLASALQQSLLARKWNNVTKLLILLIQRFDFNYAKYIRTVMQIITLLHPLIKNSTLRSDIESVAKVARTRARDVNNYPSIV